MELLPDNKEMRYLILILSLSIGAGLLFAQVKDGKEEGLASWYAGKFQGRTTASGERFDTNKLTAAHK
ncbi:MAG TPA: septal ring lytic transglycosylase RlpA family protein, partial [Spirochaetia bacterium]|nr:septal ring lytic transglycosylase RlpA family protein [Spirochaetia bacterium]